MSKVIALDIDGCLADYNNRTREEFARLGASMREWEDGKNPSMWDWYGAYGATDSQQARFTQQHFTNPRWWSEAGRHEDMRYGVGDILLQNLTEDHEVYFVTYRPRGTREVTRKWIEGRFGIYKPQVIVCGHAKEDIIHSLCADLVIEDNGTTLQAVKGCEKILVKRAYNEFAWRDPSITLVDTTIEALELAIRGDKS